MSILLESAQLPNQEALVAFIRKGMIGLAVESIRSVKVYGCQLGINSPIWHQTIELEPRHISSNDSKAEEFNTRRDIKHRKANYSKHNHQIDGRPEDSTSSNPAPISSKNTTSAQPKEGSILKKSNGAVKTKTYKSKTGHNNLEKLIDEGYLFRVIQYLGQGWKIFTKNWLHFLVFTFICGFIFIIIELIDKGTSIASQIIIDPLMYAGYYHVSFKIITQQQTKFVDFFTGLDKREFCQIMYSSLLIKITFILVAILLLFAYNLGWFFLIIFGLLTIPISLYFIISYVWIIPLILTRKMRFWSAMETSRKIITKRWFYFFLLFFILILINFCGLIMLGIGVIVTIPWSHCSIAAAYNDIIGIQNTDY
ncbi:MAG: hypothetical protein F6J89_10165 [Symploca sp. SIO1C4]|uniref:DUF975 family protein n=1 Tax=Symploca sp. SIO1C4 TaxID=2607765 RepID=A0A6B3NEB1_9CYAN|nr:hypothetical protein [Symploca sp. SIO1C4]